MSEFVHKDPEGFVPYSEVDFCGNFLSNVRYIMEVKNKKSILVGEGETPRLWIATKWSGWEYLIEDNVVKKEIHNNYKVEILCDSDDKMTRVLFTEKKSGLTKSIIRVQVININKIKIDNVDFRPIGLNLYCSQSGLHVGNMTLSGNRFEGLQTMLGVG